MTEDIRDIRGPIAEAASTPWGLYALAVIGVLAAILVIVAIMRRRRRPLTPERRALLDLAASRSLIADGDTEAFSVKVSSAVRAYVEEAFGVHAPRQTTEELLTGLLAESSPVAPYRSELGRFLELCDLAKYARLTLAHNAMTEMVASAETFVRVTAAPARGPS
ncbi:hypothetical protein BH11MYX3_BH11MYX3_22440 [soil metagenome]